MTLITGGIYPTMALLVSFLINAFLNPDISAMRARANVLSVSWLGVAVAEFIGGGLYQWSLGYSAQRMVSSRSLTELNSFLGPTSSAGVA